MKSKIVLILSIFLLMLQPVFANTEAKLEYNKGVDFYKLGQYDKSMDAFRKAVDLDPDYIDAYYNLGAILEYLGQDDRALTVFKQIIVRKPTDYEAVYKAANLCNKLGYTEKAKEMLALIPNGQPVSPKVEKLANDIALKKSQYSQGVLENITSPTGVTTDEEGNVYVAAYSDNVIYKITPDGQKIVYLKDKRLNGPIGLTRDGKGNMYVASYNLGYILKIDPTGFVTILLDGVNKPYNLHISNGILFVTSQGSNSILKIKI